MPLLLVGLAGLLLFALKGKGSSAPTPPSPVPMAPAGGIDLHPGDNGAFAAYVGDVVLLRLPEGGLVSTFQMTPGLLQYDAVMSPFGPVAWHVWGLGSGQGTIDVAWSDALGHAYQGSVLLHIISRPPVVP